MRQLRTALAIFFLTLAARGAVAGVTDALGLIKPASPADGFDVTIHKDPDSAGGKYSSRALWTPIEDTGKSVNLSKVVGATIQNAQSHPVPSKPMRTLASPPTSGDCRAWVVGAFQDPLVDDGIAIGP